MLGHPTRIVLKELPQPIIFIRSQKRTFQLLLNERVGKSEELTIIGQVNASIPMTINWRIG